MRKYLFRIEVFEHRERMQPLTNKTECYSQKTNVGVSNLFLGSVMTFVLMSFSFSTRAQSKSIEKEASSFQPSGKTNIIEAEKKATTKWYDNFSIRGYAQVRYNRLLETNENLGCEQCDKSWGKNGGFFIRRTRIIFSGQISKRVYFYIQPDIASSPSSDRLNFAQLRDAYFDIGLDDNNEFRFRIGQSKVPYGFENMQSSQNRIALDRNDALNSAVANERDLGVFFYYTPKKYRVLFAELVKSGLKGTGDYGLFGVGAYNGQTANTPEANSEPHVVARFTYPMQIKKQIIELGIQAYTGKYVLSKSNLSTGVKNQNADLNYLDQRIAASFMLYPKPFGFQAEYNIGTGPKFNKNTSTIENSNLQGGYAQMMYKYDFKKQSLIPFVKYQYYDGGKKHEKDARSYNLNDLEIGVEWQANRNFEIVADYTISNRRYEDFSLPNNLQKGSLLRLQAQMNF